MSIVTSILIAVFSMSRIRWNVLNYQNIQVHRCNQNNLSIHHIYMMMGCSFRYRIETGKDKLEGRKNYLKIYLMTKEKKTRIDTAG